MPIISPTNCRTKMCGMNPPIKNRTDYKTWYDSSSDEEHKENYFVTDCDKFEFYCQEKFECPVCYEQKPFGEFKICPQCEGEVCSTCDKQMKKCPKCRYVSASLVEAAKMGDIDMIRSILSRQDYDEYDEVIAEASHYGILDIVRVLLEYPPFDIDLDIPLYHASSQGHLEIIKLLMQHGADIHSEDEHALENAITHNKVDVVKFLLDNGANVHVGNDTPLRIAVLEGNLEIVGLLLDGGANVHANNDEALVDASRTGNINIVRLLLDNGSNVSDEALVDASSRGHMNIVRLLLDRRV